ncbi:transcriptional regulator [Elizabethkingia anophelis]|nr:transcriptional regulator [Elizabethkingia anophelis]MDV3571065.1 transcriptional regulator [Elizabethkingia anophelis]MDV3588588.1 transcriptional regulator [Elizabethkingia anophelis]MDV3717402.1 transcriptional regulator [Elizabethkingia anophelis]MDV3818871.1 transcriptional regulator [Elizabethkingia anophelis]
MRQMKINRLKIVLVEKSKTSKWLAKQLGKSESTISRWCTNEIQPSMDTFVQIAKLLNIDIKDLINSTKN